MSLHPFGSRITADTVVDTMRSFSSWEDRYRQLIAWGKLLPQFDDNEKQAQALVSGCESQVWLLCRYEAPYFYFQADSDARIVRGLIALILAAYQGKTAQAIQEFDLNEYLEQTGFIQHLTASRENGVKAIVAQIKHFTEHYQAV